MRGNVRIAPDRLQSPQPITGLIGCSARRLSLHRQGSVVTDPQDDMRVVLAEVGEVNELGCIKLGGRVVWSTA
jgi:hypothetical protein